MNLWKSYYIEDSEYSYHPELFAGIPLLIFLPFQTPNPGSHWPAFCHYWVDCVHFLEFY
jgi:hypothetical protein